MPNNAVSLDKQDSRFSDYIKAVNKIGNVIFFIGAGSRKIPHHPFLQLYAKSI